jgi:hypothetical protein
MEEKSFLDELTEDQRNEVWQLLVYTIKEMREEIAKEIENTAADWKLAGKIKSRNTLRAFKAAISIARGVEDASD